MLVMGCQDGRLSVVRSGVGGRGIGLNELI